ncbi:chorismate synthase [Nitrolancea hollandica]|uniref:Chorismate synthase n=1 Tax=Nitrolancea hollandica Lb TaxID=1129897 RepID=I4EGT6_9BACT|nr:chorismate synthase [Nitrolancea hollandica]CCF83898.1 chorismate synthase (5-enolpyruvylshikimate-3-phosphate phospholyase) [Nitrolancea hollandica Lb]
MGSTYGRLFRITTWGESHGPALGVVVDGCPAGLEISEELIQRDLDRRRVGQSKVTSPRQERDRVTILSGVFEGWTTGAPISLITYNADADSSKYDAIRDLFRPGHADYTYWMKYGHRDHRGGGRSSARETWGRVAAGAIARALLATVGIDVYAFVRQLGTIKMETFDRDQIDRNLVRCPDPEAAERMVEAITAAKDDNDSMGGLVEVRADNVPVGLGEPTSDKLDAMLGQAMMSIPAIKGIEIGEGFSAITMRGHDHNDEFYVENGRVRTVSNHAGGMLGGISNGEQIVIRLAVKPTSSVAKEQRTVDIHGNERTILVEGRHDPSICPRVVPVAEAMMTLVLADLYLLNRSARV